MGRKSSASVTVKEEEMDTSVASSVGAVGEPSTDKEEYERLCGLVNAIAMPMADRKTAKKLYKLVKKVRWLTLIQA